ERQRQGDASSHGVLLFSLLLISTAYLQPISTASLLRSRARSVLRGDARGVAQGRQRDRQRFHDRLRSFLLEADRQGPNPPDFDAGPALAQGPLEGRHLRDDLLAEAEPRRAAAHEDLLDSHRAAEHSERRPDEESFDLGWGRPEAIRELRPERF